MLPLNQKIFFKYHQENFLLNNNNKKKLTGFKPKQKYTSLVSISVLTSAHRTLNSSKGVIFELNLQCVPKSEILENVKDQNIINLCRITITKNDNKIPPNHIIFTINSTKLPWSIKWLYLKCAISSYSSNPLHCFEWQYFNHSKTSCTGNLTCG